MKSERVAYIDIAKGFTLLLVIFGHTFRDSMRMAYFWCDFLYLFLYKFHGSTLFLLSGMSYAITANKNKTLSVSSYLKKKAKSILLPWFTYSILIYIVFFAVSRIPMLSGSLGGKGVVSFFEYLKMMCCNQNPYSFHLWYLNTLFLLSVASFVMDKYLSEKMAFNFKIILISIFPLVAITVAQPWYLVAKGFVYQFPYFVVGALAKREMLERHNKKWITVGSISAILLAINTAFEESYRLSQIAEVAMFYVENICTVFVAFGIIALCYTFSKRLGMLENFGRNSMLYYIYHQPFCCAFLGAFLYDKLNVNVSVVVIACMLMSVAIPCVISKIARKTRIDKALEFFGLPS